MAVSTIPAFKAALYAAVAANASITADKVQVTYGPPFPNPERELVWLSDVAGDQEWAALGRSRRDEHFDLTLIVRVLREGTDQQGTTERAWTIAGYVETLMRADPTVSGTVIYAGFGGTEKLEEFSGDDGMSRAAILTLTVKARARI